MNRTPILASLALFALSSVASAQYNTWGGVGNNPQHTGISLNRAQTLSRIAWSTPVDLNPPYSGNSLLAHYGSSAITNQNIIIVPTKTGYSDGFSFIARRVSDGAFVWQMETGYSLPPHGWVPSVAGALNPIGGYAAPGIAGSIYLRESASFSGGNPKKFYFYGAALYAADPVSLAANVKICTPLTCDLRGNIYFGFRVLGAVPGRLQSGIAKVTIDGKGSWVSADVASGEDVAGWYPAMDCAPALSADNRRLYIAVANGEYGESRLVSIDTATLKPIAGVDLKDPNTGLPSNVIDASTSTPMVAPDGDVYYGVLDSPWGSNHLRGWMMRYTSALEPKGVPGAFGWDCTPSVVPARAVSSYTGRSSYLILTKYNHYASTGGDGQNKLAVLDPNDSQINPVNGAKIMKEVITVLGPTPDNEFPNFPDPRREWCINTCAIDPIGHGAIVNSEDGVLYRWNFDTNKLDQAVRLTAGIGEAYTPTIIAKDGTAFAINNATLFAVRALAGSR